MRPVEVKNDMVIVRADKMEANKRYGFTYKDKNYVATKREDGAVEIAELI